MKISRGASEVLHGCPWLASPSCTLHPACLCDTRQWCFWSSFRFSRNEFACFPYRYRTYWYRDGIRFSERCVLSLSNRMPLGNRSHLISMGSIETLLGAGNKTVTNSYLGSLWLFALVVFLEAFIVPRIRAKLLRLGSAQDAFRFASFVLLVFCSDLARRGASIYSSPQEAGATLLAFILLKYVVLTHRTLFVGEKRLLYLECLAWLITLRFEQHASLYFALVLDCVRIGIMLLPSASGMDVSYYCNKASFVTRQVDFFFCVSGLVSPEGHYPILLIITLLYSAPLVHICVILLSWFIPPLMPLFWLVSVFLQVYRHWQKKMPSWRRKAYRETGASFDFSKDEIERLIDIFWSLDADSNDAVDAEELARAINSNPGQGEFLFLSFFLLCIKF